MFARISREKNGKVFGTAEAQAGVNYPPMHPYCRSTTKAVIDYSKADKEGDRKNNSNPDNKPKSNFEPIRGINGNAPKLDNIKTKDVSSNLDNFTEKEYNIGVESIPTEKLKEMLKNIEVHTPEEHFSNPLKYKPYSVIDNYHKEKDLTRCFYDSKGRLVMRIDNSDHGFPKYHKKGHKHILRYDIDDKLIKTKKQNKTSGENLSKQDLIVNKDILQ